MEQNLSDKLIFSQLDVKCTALCGTRVLITALIKAHHFVYLSWAT
jgi:hypothetical protein